MNLLQLFSSIVKYNLPFLSNESKSACIEEIKQHFVYGGGVWQKFAQTLSGQGDIIGNDLAKELQTMCFNCPAHDDAYSARIIKDAFGEKYDTAGMKMIGSGTISQVYKAYDKSSGKSVAIKVMHPNIKKEIRAALDMYNGAKDSYLFPKQLKAITQLFFDGLGEQLDMKREFKNGRIFKQLLQTSKEMEETNYIVIIPEMIECSKKCLVMSYEESKLCVDLSGYDNDTLFHITECMVFLPYIAILKGFLHADLHMGNVGMRGNKLVIYDFGQMKDVRKLDKQLREQIIISKVDQDTKTYISCFVQDQEIAHRIYQFAGEGKMYDQLERCFKYMCMNNVEIDETRRAIFTSSLKAVAFYDIQQKLTNADSQYAPKNLYRNGVRKYIQTMFPYDEFKELALLFP
jgi:predicted unusual protein kinase regulating ubiquinone biosynthesis (AarF/ABC1/UbiB family)